MVKKNQSFFNAVNAAIDAFIIIFSYFYSVWLWLVTIRGDNFNAAISVRNDSAELVLLFAVLMLLIYRSLRLYGSFRFKTIWQEFWTLARANAIGMLALGTALYVFRMEDFSRGVLVVFFVLCTALQMLKRVVLRTFLRSVRHRGYNQKHVLLIGGGALARRFLNDVKNHPQTGICVDGYLAERENPELECPYLGGYDKIETLLDGAYFDETVIALDFSSEEKWEGIFRNCEKQGAKVSVIPVFNGFISGNPMVDVVGSCKLINFRISPLDMMGNAVIKRCMDIAGALVLIVLTGPLMLFAAIGTKLSSPGPVLFKQERMGLNKRRFVMYKFRSMRVNAEEKTGWSKDVDPRKTKFGSLMRKTSIDELPQFFNVLKGDMSLVGPRPKIPYYVEQFKESIPQYMMKHQVRPGITGWAQVNGYRGDTSIEERIKCDMWYIDHWSVWLDIKILFRTVFGGLVNSEKLVK